MQTTLKISVASELPLAFFSRFHGTEGNFEFPSSLQKYFILACKAPVWTACQLSAACNKLPPADGAVGIQFNGTGIMINVV